MRLIDTRGGIVAKHKGDLEIGKRAAEELLRKFPQLTEAQISRRLGFDRKSLWFWKSGETPSGFALQRMCFEGCDVKYILTGRREKE
jgi:hypothetical protein